MTGPIVALCIAIALAITAWEVRRPGLGDVLGLCVAFGAGLLVADGLRGDRAVVHVGAAKTAQHRCRAVVAAVGAVMRNMVVWRRASGPMLLRLTDVIQHAGALDGDASFDECT